MTKTLKKMVSHLPHIMTLANGIIGVGVLAMPFCFKQCGIVLAIVMLFLSSALSRFACHLLVKSAVMSRRRNFELLAFHAFGHMGKFLAELFIIGFLMGTCIAFFVVVGDLGPQIIGKIIDKDPADIRTSFLITTAAFVVLPLGLLRNIDSLSSVCTATIGFYLLLVLKVIGESGTHVFAGDWFSNVFYWRSSGILQCLPIFSMALFCQTQLFEIYEVIPNVSLEKMNLVVRGALNICTIVYVCVGFFGYVAFCTQPFTGNILMSFEPSLSSEAIKMGFVLSVAFSFPLVIFPCRASMNSLLFRGAHSHEALSNYIPTTRFRCLTIVIVIITLVTGILIPNIELVLGLVGSTIGVIICLMFPAFFFISISSKNTNERLLAQVMIFIGMWIMVLGTYANLYASEDSLNVKLVPVTSKTLDQMNDLPLVLDKVIVPDILELKKSIEKLEKVEEIIKPPDPANKLAESFEKKDDVRQEPPIPVERVVVTEKPPPEQAKSHDIVNPTLSPAVKEIVEEIKKMSDQNIEKKNAEAIPALLGTDEKPKLMEIKDDAKETMQKNDNLIHSDAIKKEDTELAADGELATNEKKLEMILAKHEIEQRKLIMEQKKVLAEMRVIKQELRQEEKEQMSINDAQRRKSVQESLKLPEKPDRKNPENRNEVEKKSLPDQAAATGNKNENRGNVRNKAEVENRDKERREVAAEVNKNYVKQKGQKINDTVSVNSRGPILNALSGKNVRNVNSENVRVKMANEENDKLISHNAAAEPKNEQKKQEESKNVNVLSKSLVENAKAKSVAPVEDRIERDAVLTKKQLENAVPQNVEKTGVLANAETEGFNSTKESSKKSVQFPMPIAILMNNNSRKTENDEHSTSKNSEDGISAIRREILENHGREKREIAGILENHEKEGDSFAKDLTNGSAAKKCAQEDNVLPRIDEKKVEDKLVGNGRKSVNAKRESTTQSLLIKTNSYLSDPRFPNEIPLDGNFKVNADFVEPEQRNLKFLDSDNRDKA